MSRMTASRKSDPAVQKMFEQYVQQNTRRLNKEEAMLMLQTEFNLRPVDAEKFFHHFDADRNGFLSLWEFQHFCTVVGKSAADIVKQFEQLDKDCNGLLDIGEAWDGLKAMTESEQLGLKDEEIAFFIKTAVSDQDTIDLGQFADLMARLRIYKQHNQKK